MGLVNAAASSCIYRRQNRPCTALSLLCCIQMSAKRGDRDSNFVPWIDQDVNHGDDYDSDGCLTVIIGRIENILRIVKIVRILKIADCEDNCAGDAGYDCDDCDYIAACDSCDDCDDRDDWDS